MSEQNFQCFPENDSLTSIDDALAIINRVCSFAKVGQQSIAVSQALNRILAKDIFSPRDIPGFDNVAVDGYGFSYSSLPDKDLQECWLPVVEQVRAGDCINVVCEKGKAVRVLTGAILPDGVDTVIMDEQVLECKKHDGINYICVAIDKIKEGSNWRKKGEDVKAGSCVLDKGHCLNAIDIGLLASLGMTHIEVFDHLPIAIFSTGNELKSAGEVLLLDSVIDVNRPMLKQLVSKITHDVYDGGIIKDDYALIRKKILLASDKYPVIFTSGGASFGDADHITRLLHDEGKVYFHRIAVKPGRPFIFGQFNNSLVFGFPGNPVAVVVCFYLLARFGLLWLAGNKPRPYQYFSVPSGFDMQKKPGRTEWLRVKLKQDADGVTRAYKSGAHGSGILTSVVNANGFVELSADSIGVKRNEMVKYIIFSELNAI